MTFLVLPATTELADARNSLAKVSYLVLVREDGAPLALLTSDLLASAPEIGALDQVAWPPVITIPAWLSAEAFVSTAGVTLLDLSDAIPGLVLLDGARPVGVLLIATIDNLLATGGCEPPSTTMGPFGNAGDAALPGEVDVPHARVRCAASGCGFVNELVFYDRSVPPQCANPDLDAHRLIVAAWDG